MAWLNCVLHYCCITAAIPEYHLMAQLIFVSVKMNGAKIKLIVKNLFFVV